MTGHFVRPPWPSHRHGSSCCKNISVVHTECLQSAELPNADIFLVRLGYSHLPGAGQPTTIRREYFPLFSKSMFNINYAAIIWKRRLEMFRNLPFNGYINTRDKLGLFLHSHRTQNDMSLWLTVRLWSGYIYQRGEIILKDKYEIF